MILSTKNLNEEEGTLELTGFSAHLGLITLEVEAIHGGEISNEDSYKKFGV
jgi:hypothetical protein